MTSTKSAWLEFLKKTLFAIGGLVVASLVSFLNSNPTLFGSVTVLVTGILSALEAQIWPSVTVTSANLQVQAAKNLGVAPVVKQK